MKLKFTKVASALLLSILFMSCGEDIIKEKQITANDISIIGEGKNYIKVVDGDYKLKVVDGKIFFPIKLELIKKHSGTKPKMGNLTLVPLDASNIAVADIGLNFSPASMSDWSKVEGLLQSEVNESVMVNFKWSYFSNEEKMARIMKETNNFEITRTEIKEQLAKSETPKSTKTSKKSERKEVKEDLAVGNSKVDDALDSYEDYVDQYLKFLKKANNGDTSALSEYPALMQKATNMQSKMDDMKDDFSSKQMARMMKIQNKMTMAALEMQ